MKLIRGETGFNYLAGQNNHRVYLPPIEVLPRTIASVDASDRGKGIFYETFHPTKSLAGNIRHPQSCSTEQAGTNTSTEDTSQAHVMTDRELLISLHQKVDRNHDWTKRQISEILTYIAQMHTSQKKTH